MNFLKELQKNYKIILASSSPRRSNLLKSIGLDFEVQKPNLDEKSIPYGNPPNYCQTLALSKVVKVYDTIANETQPTLLIAADTIVVKNNNIINKPTDKQDAINILNTLNNNCHKVYTGVAMLNSKNRQTICRYSETDVHFRKLSDNEILEYVNSGQPMDKAGAYGIQDDYGALFVHKICGCFYNVVGLPLELVFAMLKKIAPDID